MTAYPEARPRVVISSGGVFHAYHMARGAEQAGLLERFITRIYNRYETGIPRHKVRQAPLPWAIGYLISQLPGSRAAATAAYLSDTLFDRAACRHLGTPDIFHVFNNYGYDSLPLARERGAITIVERASAHPDVQAAILREEYARHGLTYPDRYTRLNQRVVAEYDRADYIMVCSEFVRATMRQAGIPADKLISIQLGFDPTRFQPGPKHDDVFRVLYAGAISLQKGLPYLLEAFTQLALPNSELLLVGRPTPDAAGFLQRYAGHYRQRDFVPQADLVQFYQQASVFVLPSLQDGFGMVVYEAAACGLPVIVTEHVGAEIRDGIDGFRVPIRNSAALADRLRQLYEQPDLRAALGQAAYQYVQQFTWQRYHQQLTDIYHTLWNKKTHAG